MAKSGTSKQVGAVMRVYLDLKAEIVHKAKVKALTARIPLKRYVELLVERDCKGAK